jgi:hypothetical protein
MMSDKFDRVPKPSWCEPFAGFVGGTYGIVTLYKVGWSHVWVPLRNRDLRGTMLAEDCERRFDRIDRVAGYGR